ncbi:MAG: PEP-CTERM sorting domain-containing protein, partial [Candidatus Peregrinibacteria bacterium]
TVLPAEQPTQLAREGWQNIGPLAWATSGGPVGATGPASIALMAAGAAAGMAWVRRKKRS